MRATRVMAMATAAATEPMRMSRLRMCISSCASTPLISFQERCSMRPAVMATAAFSGLRPVAKALGCGLGVTYRRGLGSLARAANSSTTAWYSGNS